MDRKYNLTVEDLLNKQFHVDFKGYAPVEVDEFLDLVIADYKEYAATIEKLGSHLQDYEQKVQELQAKIHALEVEKEMSVPEEVFDHVDVLKRLTRLENEVFKNKN